MGGLGDEVSFMFERGTLVLPSVETKEETTSPVILVGPGTGLAPLRAIIQQRVNQGQYGE